MSYNDFFFINKNTMTNQTQPIGGDQTQPTEVTRKIKILVVPSDRSGVAFFRSTNPHIQLEKMYPNEFRIDINYNPQIENEEWLKQYDLIHFHRNFGPYEKMAETMERLRKLGIPSIMDIDDYWAPGQHHPAYLIIKTNKLPEKIIGNLKLAQYISTTTTTFANEIKKYNKNTIVIPNAIDVSEKQYISKVEPSKRIRIAWLGGSSHLRDLEILKGVVNKLKSDTINGEPLLNKVQFVLCGYDLRGTITDINEETGQQVQRKVKPIESVWYKYEQLFTDNYTTISPEYKEHLMKFTEDEYHDIDNEPYRRVWTKPVTSYATNYNLFDVALAPLEENIFNKCKSPLKVVESGFHKKALIAQDFGPYQIDCIDAYERGGTINPDGNSFLVPSVKNHKGWYEHIKRLIVNPELISQLGENLHNTIKDRYSMEAVCEVRRSIYKEIINNK